MPNQIQTAFKSDGCTGWFDGNWRQCCVEHDYLDFIGISDTLADMTMHECVATFSPIMALIMFVGVKLFRPFYRLLFKR